jgi:hypothetical protein
MGTSLFGVKLVVSSSGVDNFDIFATVNVSIDLEVRVAVFTELVGRGVFLLIFSVLWVWSYHKDGVPGTSRRHG